MQLKILNTEPKKRDVILNAALKEFSLKGFDNASTNVIAKEAGISKGLMFHYINSKKDLFLFLYDYCADRVNKEYIDLMNFNEKDIFKRLRKSYILQIELLKQHPWIFDFIMMSDMTNSEEINKKLEERVNEKLSQCQKQMFEIVDETKFRAGLNLERCKQIIFWTNVGFTNEILEDIRKSSITELDRSEEHTSELQSRGHLVCSLLLEKKNKN